MKKIVSESDFLYIKAVRIIDEVERNLRFLRTAGPCVDSYNALVIFQGEETITKCKELIIPYLN